MALQEEFVKEYIYEYSKRPKYSSGSHVYNFECPICHEGTSTGRKRRGFYIPHKNHICCHNCLWKSTPEKWINQITGKPFREIYEENREFVGDAAYILTDTPKEKGEDRTLPVDSINIYNKSEVEYYIHDKTFRNIVKYARDRRLYTAINKPKSLFVSLKDRMYENCLCFPFYNNQNKIDFFQVRNMDSEGPKYYGKKDAEKSIFNLHNIDEKHPNIFIFEGPIDSMFLQNGISIGGIGISEHQKALLSIYPLHKKIWCLDNQQVDKSSKEATVDLLERGENVFIWPNGLKKYKDINELCCDRGLDSINPDFILKHTYSNKIEAIASGFEIV